MSETVVEVEGLRKSYRSYEAVKGIDFSITRGEIFGFLGTNGAGKTTTIEILEGYRPRSAGRVSVLGTDPAHPSRPWRDRIGLVLQDSELDPLYSVRETVRMFASYYSNPRDIDATIDMVGLHDKRDARIGALSGGQKRRVDVALGIIGDPELLFLDEPTTGFDPQARRGAWTMIECLRDSGVTVFLTTHYMDEAQHLADRLVILRAGEIVAAGTTAELTAQVREVAEIRFTLPAGITADTVRAAINAPADIVGSLVTVAADDPQPTLLRLLTWAGHEDVTLDGLTVSRPSLDDVFLELTADAAPATEETP